MKKILIIDDCENNLKAAKIFFENVTGYSFIFCSSREEADKEFDTAFAVITDRDFPYSNDTRIKEAEKAIDKREIPTNFNGYYMAVKSKYHDKPVVMTTEHGIVGIATVDPSFSRKEFEKLESNVKEACKMKDIIDLMIFCDHQMQMMWFKHLRDKSAYVWKIAFEKLLEQV